MCEALTYHLDNIFIRFDTILYRQIVGIPMGINCSPHIADLFFLLFFLFLFFCNERDVMTSLSDDKEAEIIQAFNSTSRHLGGLFK